MQKILSYYLIYLPISCIWLGKGTIISISKYELSQLYSNPPVFVLLLIAFVYITFIYTHSCLSV